MSRRRNPRGHDEHDHQYAEVAARYAAHVEPDNDDYTPRYGYGRNHALEDLAAQIPLIEEDATPRHTDNGLDPLATAGQRDEAPKGQLQALENRPQEPRRRRNQPDNTALQRTANLGL